MGRYIQEEEEFRVLLFKTNKEPEQKKQSFHQQPYQPQRYLQPDQKPFFPQSGQYGETFEQTGAFYCETSQTSVPFSPCVFCDQKGHYHQDCETVCSLTDRQNIIAKKMLCSLCLKPGHGIKDNKCDQRFRSKRCFHCGGFGFHNSALCPIKYQDKVSPAPPMNQPAKPGRGNQQQQQQHSHSGIKVVECLSKSSFSKKNSYLMTANVFIKNPFLPQGGRWVKAFIDSGCGQTYILKNLSKELWLPVERTEYLQFNVFLNKSRGCNSDVVKLQVFLQDGSILEVEANTVPSTTGPITRESLKQTDFNALHEVGLGQLADDIPNRSHAFTPEIVFGIDYWNQLFPGGKQIPLPSGLKLHPSSLGYLLVGHTRSHQPINSQVHNVNFVRSNSFQPTWRQKILPHHSIPLLKSRSSVKQRNKRLRNKSISIDRSQVDHRHPRIQMYRSPTIGEVFPAKDADRPRGAWKMGRNMEINISKDKEIRSAKVKLPSKRVVNRLINPLYPLEIPVTQAPDNQVNQIVPNFNRRPFQQSDKCKMQKRTSRNDCDMTPSLFSFGGSVVNSHEGK